MFKQTMIAAMGCLLLAAGCHTPLRAVTESHVTTSSPPMIDTGPLAEFTVVPGDPAAGERIALVDIDGVLLNTDMTGFYSFGENPVALFREKLDHIAANRCFRGVVLRINSPGGGVTACDIMRRDLMTFKARTGLPVVACLLDVGAGGAYYLATAADQVVAHPTTVTGGIGVVLNLYNLQDAMAQFNVVGVPVKSGEHIDMGSPIRGQSDDVRAMLQTMAFEFHQRFREAVEQSRPRHDPAHPEDFDGRVFTAGQALEKHLVDSIGYLDDAVAIARQASRVPTARVVLLHRRIDRARTPYAITPNVPMQGTMLPLSIPGFERSRLPTFLYLWQPDPTLERWGGK
ncbi:MAG TPA: S49 family peptidase [Pirellulales bacterium]|nr:S49 family peptidase [Pirellulales bacterium]